MELSVILDIWSQVGGWVGFVISFKYKIRIIFVFAFFLFGINMEVQYRFSQENFGPGTTVFRGNGVGEDLYKETNP